MVAMHGSNRGHQGVTHKTDNDKDQMTYRLAAGCDGQRSQQAACCDERGWVVRERPPVNSSAHLQEPIRQLGSSNVY